MADEPLGSLDEILNFRLDPRFTHACCDGKEKEIAGCPVAHLCDLPEKARTGLAPPGWDHEKRNWCGPVNKAVRIMKPTLDGGVGVKNEIVKCHTYILQRDNLMDNGGAVDIVGHEGDEIEIAESTRIIDPTAEGGVRYEPGFVMKVVPRHKRLKDLPAYRNRLTLEKKRQAMEQKERAERGARMLGMTPEEAGVHTEDNEGTG
jgi:hypothetical protein